MSVCMCVCVCECGCVCVCVCHQGYVNMDDCNQYTGWVEYKGTRVVCSTSLQGSTAVHGTITL